MFVLIIMLVTFFIVAFSSWWLEDFAVAEDEQTTAKSALAPTGESIVTPCDQLSPRPILATIST